MSVIDVLAPSAGLQNIKFLGTYNCVTHCFQNKCLLGCA